MKFIETFFWGAFIACTALIAQVFVTVISEIFFKTTLTFQYLLTDTIIHVSLLMLIAATIEELLRYLIIKKRISIYVSGLLTSLIYGIALGIGFASFETFLALAGHTISLNILFMMVPIFVIHIILSIFLLFFIKSKVKPILELHYLIISIVLHTIGNLIIFHFLT